MADYYVDLSGSVTKNKKKKKTIDDFTTDYFVDLEGNVTKKNTAQQSVSFREVKAQREKDKNSWVKSGAFGDGKGNALTDTLLSVGSTIGDIGLGIVKGIGNSVEGVADLATYGEATIAEKLGKKEYAERTRKFAKQNTTQQFLEGLDNAVSKYSLLGAKADILPQAIGNVAALGATAAGGALAGLGKIGTTVLTTGTTFAGSAGSGMSEAYQGGAKDKEAAIYGMIAGAGETASELLFGGLGKGAGAVGLSSGVLSLDDELAKKVGSKFTNQIAKNFAEFGIKSAAEGTEEVLSGIISAVGKKVSYMSEEELGQILKDENLLEQFVVGTVTSGIAQSGYLPGMKDGSLREANKKGTDFLSGLTSNEQKVVDKEVKSRIAEQEKDGKKLTTKERSIIEDEVVEDLKKGYISIDIIENALGGETYGAYKSLSDEMEEYNSLNKMKVMEMTGEQSDRLAELKEKNKQKSYQSEKTRLKEQLSKEVSEMTMNDRFLQESYNERSKRGQAFEADTKKYNAKMQTTIQKAIDSGILNNTRRTHEFVDMIAKISADKGVSFDFTNNQRLKESGFAKEGVSVNGYIKDGNVTLNINSAKTLNKVVGHEITHVLEGSGLYAELQEAVKAYATTKGEYNSKLEAITKLYEGVEGANVEQELTADLIGEYLFTDEVFVQQLSAKNRNIFQKIYDEIKYLVKTVTSGSKEAKQLEKVKRAFEKAYKDTKNDTETKFSVSEDEKLHSFIEKSLAKEIPDKYRYEITSTISDKLATEIENIVGFSVKGYKNKITPGRIRHIFKRHGSNGEADNSMSNTHDLAKIGYVIENFDSIIEGKEQNTEFKNRDDSYAKTIVLQKKINDQYYYVVEAVPDSTAKTLFVVSAYINKKDTIAEAGIAQGHNPDVRNELQSDVSSNDSIPKTKENATENKKFSFAGADALTADNDARINAYWLEQEGKSESDIFKETGWFRGADGKWRFEIDDSEAKIYRHGDAELLKKPIYKEYQELSKDLFDGFIDEKGYERLKIITPDAKTIRESKKIKTVSDYMEHPKLYDAYPFLANIPVVQKEMKGTTRGSFSVTEGIEINKEYFGEYREKVLKKILLHELQHAIQHYERFAGGANTETWSNIKIKKNQKKMDEAVKRRMAAFNGGTEEFKNLIRKLNRMQSDQDFGEEYTRVENELFEKYEERYREYDEAQFEVRLYMVSDYLGDGEKYLMTAGEIEAREVADRADWGVEIRKEKMPKRETENGVIFSENLWEPFEYKERQYSLGNDISPTGKWNVKGSDIVLDDSTPIRKDIAPAQNREVSEKQNQDEPETLIDGPFTGQEEKTTPEDEEVIQFKGVNARKIKNIQAKIQGLQVSKDVTKKEFGDSIAKKKEEYEGLKRKDTEKASKLLEQITNLEYRRDDTIAELDRKIEGQRKAMENIKKQEVARQRKRKQNELQNRVRELIGDTSTWKDKKNGISYQVNTLRRNLRDVVRDADGNRDIAKADEIYDALQGKYNINEAELNREANRIKQVFAGLKINTAENTYIQMLGEYRHNPDTTISAEVIGEYYEKHKSKIDNAKVDKAIETARKLYDSLFYRVNSVLREQGMQEIGYREGYFPHFTEEKQGVLGKIFNWKTQNNDIPTDIAGLTEQFNPNRSWQSFNKHRTGDDTDYNFMKGLDNYVNGALDWIYHIEDIQMRRAVENEIRYRHSEKGIQEKIDAVYSNPFYDADEAQAEIDKILKEAKNPLNNFVTDMRKGTNVLAGKKDSGDRYIEEKTSRKIYSTMTNISNRVTANMVAGSVSSALTNFIPITQSWGQVSPVSSVIGMAEALKSYVVDDGTVDKSNFLTNRLRQNTNLYQTGWDKAGNAIGFMMEAVDNFTSQTVWRSKYMENVKNGMSEDAAIKDADQFAENVIAGRSRGNMPTIFNEKNLASKMFTAFQLEVANQYGYMLKDMPQDMRNQSKGKLVQGYVSMFVGAYVYNALYSALTGRDAAFDPIRILQELMGDLFGDDGEEGSLTKAITNLATNVVEEIPFIGGLVGGGRIPISSALPYEGLSVETLSGVMNDLSEGNMKNFWQEILKPVYYVAMPMGGGQTRKTIQGLQMFDDDLPIAGSYTNSGKLRFSVDDDFPTKAQAAVFGQYANKNAREYFDEGRTPLSEKKTQELADLDIPISDYWDIEDDLKGKKKLADKAEYIANLDLPVVKKNILINNRTTRKEEIDLTDYSLFDDFKEFDFAMSNKEEYQVARAAGGYKSYATYKKQLGKIEADKDAQGKSISGSRKEKVVTYLNSINASYEEKLILYKREYPSDDRYNQEIIDYLNNRKDITYSQMETILKELGFMVDADGTIRW